MAASPGNSGSISIRPSSCVTVVGINDVINAINNNTANAGGGRVSRGDQSFIVRGVGLVHNLDDLGNVVVTQTNSMPVLVRDLGTLSYAHQEPEGILGMNGNPSTIEGIVTGLKYQNVSEVIDSIHAKVDELRKQLEPQDVHIVTVLDRGDLVAATVDKIGHTVTEGIGLVIIVLMLFLGSPRSALVVAVTIPLGRGFDLRADERDPYVGEHAVAGCTRFRRDCRRRDRGDGKHPAPSRIRSPPKS